MFQKYSIALVIIAVALIVQNEETEALCDFGCGFYFKPLCALDVDNKTTQFESDCQLSVARCKHPQKNYEIIKRGPCDVKEEAAAAANKTEATTN